MERFNSSYWRYEQNDIDVIKKQHGKFLKVPVKLCSHSESILKINCDKHLVEKLGFKRL